MRPKITASSPIRRFWIVLILVLSKYLRGKRYSKSETVFKPCFFNTLPRAGPTPLTSSSTVSQNFPKISSPKQYGQFCPECPPQEGIPKKFGMYGRGRTGELLEFVLEGSFELGNAHSKPVCSPHYLPEIPKSNVIWNDRSPKLDSF